MLDQLSAAAPTIAALVIAVLGAILVLELRSRLRRFEGAVYELRAPLRNLEPERFFESLHGLLRTSLAQLAGGGTKAAAVVRNGALRERSRESPLGPRLRQHRSIGGDEQCACDERNE